MEETKNTCFTVFSLKCAGYLLTRGFVLVRAEPDRRGTGRTVCFFKKSPELIAAIEDYKKTKG